jgi:hypothetical protein
MLMDKLSFEELEKQINEAKQRVTPGSKWRHYKGGEYTISNIVVMEENQQLAVVYTSMAHPEVSFIRPLSVWVEQVEWEGKTVQRFAPIA